MTERVIRVSGAAFGFLIGWIAMDLWFGMDPLVSLWRDVPPW
jgi:hypothetical protein